MSGWISKSRPLLIALGLAVLVYAASYLLAPTYLGYFTLYFPNTSATPMLLAGIRNSGESDQSAVRNFGGALNSPLVASGTQSATGIVESAACAKTVVDNLELAKAWGLKRGEAIEEFKDLLSTSVEKSGFMKVEVIGDSRELCVNMLKEVYSHLSKRADELTINVSRNNREFVEKRVAEATREVDRRQDDLTKMLTDFKLSGYDAIQGRYLEARNSIDEGRVQLAIADEVMEINKRSLQEMIKLSKNPELRPLVLPYVSDSLSGLASNLEQKRVAVENAMGKFTDSSEEVRIAKREMSFAQKLADERVRIEQDALKEDVSPQFRSARVQQETLRATLTQNEELLKRYEALMPVSADQYARLERAKTDFETSMLRLATLRGELEIARIAEDRDPSRFEIVDEPQTEWKPVGPRRALMSGGVFLLALIVQLWPTIARKLKEDE